MDLQPHVILLVIIAIWITFYIISRILPFERYGLEVYPIFMIYKTKRFNSFFKIIARKKTKFLRTIWNIGVVMALGAMIYAVYLLFSNLLHFIYMPEQAQRVFLIVPGVTISLRWFPYLIIAISLAITTHELAHGVAACLEKIKILSSGIILTPITFGGFVETDEKQFKKASLFSRLRIISAGSLTNMMIGILVLLITVNMFTSSSGVLITDLKTDGSAYKAGIRKWGVIQYVNGNKIEDLNDLYIFMSKVEPLERLIVETNNGIWKLNTAPNLENSSKVSIGVTRIANYIPMRYGALDPSTSYHIFQTLNWVSTLMINLAIFNMMPFYPLDGDAFISTIIDEKKGNMKYVKFLRIILNSFSILLLVANIGFSYIKYGIAPV